MGLGFPPCIIARYLHRLIEMSSASWGQGVRQWLDGSNLQTDSSSGYGLAPRPDSSPGTAVCYLWLRLSAFLIFYIFFSLEMVFRCIALAESKLLGEISPPPLAIPSASFADF